MNITAAERATIATKVCVSEQYLYQCLTGRRAIEPAEAVRIERETEGRIKRWHLRQRDWHLIWPELIGIEGAPHIPAAQEARDAA